MEFVALVGRVLFSLLFLTSAMGHLTNVGAMASIAESKRWPRPRLSVVASGLYIGVAALMVILGIFPDLGALALTLFLVLTAVFFHNFWTEAEPRRRMEEQIQFLKDLALAGGALVIFALYAGGQAPGFTLTDPLFLRP